MGRSAILKPVLRKKQAGRSQWVVNIPPHISDTGARRQVFFATKIEAQTVCNQLKVRQDNFGISLTSMTPTRIAEAAEAFNLLEGINVSLLSAVRSVVDAHNLRAASITFLALFDLFLAEKADKNPKYLKQLEITRNRFPSLRDRIVSDITPEELRPLMSAISPGGRNPVMRYLRAVFFFGVKRGYLKENPINRLDFAERKRKEIEIIPYDKVQAMLEDALKNDLPLLPYLIFGCFAGIRPDGELQKLEWSDMKLAEGTIVIRPEVSKTNRRRFPKISANAAAWIEAYRERGGTFDGKVSLYTGDRLRDHRTDNWKAAGITKWIQQGMRHTFCSNWLAFHKDVNELVLQSGHDNVDTMWRNYHKGVAETEAIKFWNIMPPSAPVNVVVLKHAFQA
jgi:integrase